MPPSISKQHLKYHLTSFRTSNAYLIFQFCQLILSIVIITTALISDHLFRQPIVLYLELLLLISMTIDLFLIKLITQQKACGNKNMKIDWVIYSFFLFTFCFMSFTESKVQRNHEKNQYQVLLQIDDIILIFLIILRYIVQIYQMVNTIQDTQNNMDCEKHIKNFDLNKTPYASVMEQNNQVIQDEIIRQRIWNKKKGQSQVK